jgi:hypothetical protein
MIRDEDFRQTARSVIRNDPSRPIKRAYDYVLREQRRNEQTTGAQRQPVREFVNIRSSLSRAKSCLVPNLPDDIHSVLIDSPWSENWSSERFLLHIDPNCGIAIFCTDENLKILRKCNEIYIDGTFRSSQNPTNSTLLFMASTMEEYFALFPACLPGSPIITTVDCCRN